MNLGRRTAAQKSRQPEAGAGLIPKINLLEADLLVVGTIPGSRGFRFGHVAAFFGRSVIPCTWAVVHL
jgi:hypothetical protein